MRKKRKVIEVVEGYASIGETGHIVSEVKFGLLAWGFPIVYKHEAPNPDKFRKVRITYEEMVDEAKLRAAQEGKEKV